MSGNQDEILQGIHKLQALERRVTERTESLDACERSRSSLESEVSRLTAENTELRAKCASDLEILTSFDCTWGIESGRHCPDDKPCMAHRFAAVRLRLGEAVELLRPFAEYATLINKWCPAWTDDGGVSSLEQLYSRPEISIPELGAFRRAAAFLATLPEPPTTIAAAMDDAERDWERRYMNTEPQDEGG